MIELDGGDPLGEVDLTAPGRGRGTVDRRSTRPEADRGGGTRRSAASTPTTAYPGGVHLRQPGDRGQRDPRRLDAPVWRSCCFSAPPASIPARRPQPMPRTALLTGPLEPTNEWYAVAKIAG